MENCLQDYVVGGKNPNGPRKRVTIAVTIAGVHAMWLLNISMQKRRFETRNALHIGDVQVTKS